MKNNRTLWAIATALVFLFLIFAWLFWGSTVPEPTDPGKSADRDTVKAEIFDTVLNREANGKKLWEVKVGEARQLGDDLVKAKKLEGTLYLDNGDEMYFKAEGAEVRIKTNDFVLTDGVTVRLKQGGFMKANRVEWKQKEDILTATGAVKVIKEDLLAQAEQIITSSKLEHFKLKDKAHVERGGRYEEE